MTVVDVRVVRMAVRHAFVDVPVGVRLARGSIGLVVVLVVLVVPVAVGVLKPLVPMGVSV